MGLDDGNEAEEHPFHSKIPRSQTTICNNGIKTGRKSKSYEKTKGLAGNKDNMNRGHHHG